MQASSPRWCGEERTAHVREQCAVGPKQREVGLGVASVDSEDHGVRHARAPTRRASASVARRSSKSSDAVEYWPINGWASKAFLAGDRVTGKRSLRGEPLVGGHVLNEAQELGGERRLRQRDRTARSRSAPGARPHRHPRAR